MASSDDDLGPQGVVVPDDGLGPRGVVVPDDDDLLSCDSDMLEQGLPSRLRVRDDGFSSDDNLGPRGLCDAPRTKRRGLPPKLGAQLVAAPEQPAPPETCDLNLLAWFRPHSDVQESSFTCLTHPYRNAACVENVARVMDHLFGERRRVIGCALSLEAVALGINEKSLPDYILEAQATSYIGLVLAVESFCDYVGGCIADGSCSPVAAFTSTKNDETSLILRVEDEFERASWGAGGQAPKRSKYHAQGVVAKILQTIAEFGFVLRQRDGKHILLRCSLTAPVQVMGANTGESLRRCVDAVWDLPRLKLLLQRFPRQIHLTCNDRAGANNRCEKFYRPSMQPQELRLRTTCDVHKVDTAQGQQLALVPGHISRLIAFALAAKIGSALAGLQRGLGLLFKAKLRIYRGAFPNGPETDLGTFREATLDLYMSPRRHGPSALKRRCVVQRMLNGDWGRADIIEHVCPPGCCNSEEATRQTFATQVFKTVN